MTPEQLRTALERWNNLSGPDTQTHRTELLSTLRCFLQALSDGRIRAAMLDPDGSWRVQAWVKQGILLCFRVGQLSSIQLGEWQFTDLDLLPPRWFRPDDRVRLVPGGSTVRTGAY
ncbi:MAG: 2,3,4,5-tetrahydropyridine-2,6-dicarboxylate N-succinyltransferase, partial [Bacteroidota bacterium]|nr:2,3,4,5-tetrahydropyridine-2,6-dicarboxylate N-succinyltransferase [Bacteroidota bacterium]